MFPFHDNMTQASSSMDPIFRPSSVAVIGASRKAGTVGHTLFRNLLAAEFSGIVYPVNPHWGSVGGVKSYPSIATLPGVPDLAVVIVPAPDVPPVFDELGKKGVRGAIIVSAGFREIGGQGIRREADLVRIATKHNIRVVGPNCFGVINTDPDVRLNATFSETLPSRGNLAFISQSGALGQGILLYARHQGIGLTKFVSVGNRAGVNECDIIADLAADDATKVILLYLESLADGRRFLSEVKSVAARKPVIIIKSGRTPLGEEASRSHTGSLAHALSDSLYDAVFDEMGVLRADSIADLFRMARTFASCEIPAGPRLAILTNSGGPGILAADVAARGGLQLPPLPEAARKKIERVASPNASSRNPVDLTADATSDTYRRTLRVLAGQRGIDSVLVIGTPTGQTTGHEIARSIIEQKRQGQPIVACLFGVNDLSDEAALLERHGIPNFTFPEEAAKVVCELARYSSLRSRGNPPTPRFKVGRGEVNRRLTNFRTSGFKSIPDHQARDLLRLYGLKFPASRLTHDGDSAVEAAHDIGYPVALKVASSDILHKTDVGGVVLHIDSDAELVQAMGGMQRNVARNAPNARVEGYVVEKLETDGFEVIVGIRRDPDFGPVMLFGMGGIYAETLKDVSFRPAPLTSDSAWRLIDGVRASKVLRGVRGEGPRDIDALHEALLRISQFATEQPLVEELDINPLMVLPNGSGVVAVDCRLILA